MKQFSEFFLLVDHLRIQVIFLQLIQNLSIKLWIRNVFPACYFAKHLCIVISYCQLFPTYPHKKYYDNHHLRNGKFFMIIIVKNDIIVVAFTTFPALTCLPYKNGSKSSAVFTSTFDLLLFI